MIDSATGEDLTARSGFVIVRARRNGDLPSDYLRAFEIVGRDGLARLAYGARTAAHVFEARGEAENVLRRLRRRAVIGGYDYLVEAVGGQAGADAERVTAMPGSNA